MRIERVLAAAGAAFVMLLGSVAAQQAPAAPAQPPAAPAAGRGQGPGRGRVATFPAQQRPPGDPALIERGKTLYSSICSACHGVDARGGQLGGPNLLRSQLVLNDQAGELILPVVKADAPNAGCRPFRCRTRTSRRSRSISIASRPPVVARRAAGERGSVARRAGRRRGCRAEVFRRQLRELSLADWRSPGARDARPRREDAADRLGRGDGRRRRARRPRAADSRSPRATTLPSGEKVEGRLVQIDHFLVTVVQADNTLRSVNRDDKTKVEITDPLAAHKAMLSTLTDKDMHDVTAFLATLK